MNTENKKTEIKGVNSFKGYDLNGNFPSMNKITDDPSVKQPKKNGYLLNSKTGIQKQDVIIKDLPLYTFPSRLPSDLPVFARPPPAGLTPLTAFRVFMG